MDDSIKQVQSAPSSQRKTRKKNDSVYDECKEKVSPLISISLQLVVLIV